MEDDILRLQTEKMESISILAGGIAHDFNNILTAILGNITIAKMHINREDRSFKLLTEAEKASLRAKDLTQQLLTFSKGGAPVKKSVSISGLLKDTTEFALSGSKTSYNLCVPDDLWPVEIDAGQISQVINNLIINADQAMPGGGMITVHAENVTVGQNEHPLQQGTYVKISITDEGIGIPHDHLQKIFDPYFTTKQKGSGLGLAICDSIVRTHDGHITVESRLGVGTTFYIWLPVTHTEPVTRRKGVEKIIKGKGCILLMDDEECILEATGEILHYLGYTVVTARDGREAVDTYKKALTSCQPFDVVIMDLTIPGGMGGKETLHHLLEIDPDVKAIVSSGYSDNPVTAQYKEYGFSGAVTKPYTVRELSETLHRILKNEEKTP
jgi:CheY-like chemotaxis protein